MGVIGSSLGEALLGTGRLLILVAIGLINALIWTFEALLELIVTLFKFIIILSTIFLIPLMLLTSAGRTIAPSFEFGTLAFEPDVIATLLSLLASAALTRLVDDKRFHRAFFRYDFSVSIAVTIAGFAFLNLLRGHTVGVAFPITFELAGNSRSIHLLALILAAIIATFASRLFTRLSNTLASVPVGETLPSPNWNWLCSILTLCFSAATLLWYFSAFLTQNNNRDALELLLIAAVTSLSGLWICEAVSWWKYERRHRVLLCIFGKTAFPIGLGETPYQVETLIAKGTETRSKTLPLDFDEDTETKTLLPIESLGIRRPRSFLNQDHITLSIFQGSRPISSSQEELLTVQIPIQQGREDVVLKTALDIDEKGRLQATIRSDDPAWKPERIELPHSTTDMGLKVDLVRICLRKLSGLLNHSTDQQLQYELLSRWKWLSTAIPAIARVLKERNRDFPPSSYSRLQDDYERSLEALSISYPSPEDFNKKLRTIVSTLSRGCDEFGIEHVVKETDS